jgi:hypothetical protein
LGLFNFRNKAFTANDSDIENEKLANEVGKFFERGDNFLKTYLYFHSAVKVKNKLNGRVN